MNRQISDACPAMSVDHIVVLIEEAAIRIPETNRGLAPLLCAVMNLSPSEVIEDMIIEFEVQRERGQQYGFTPS